MKNCETQGSFYNPSTWEAKAGWKLRSVKQAWSARWGETSWDYKSDTWSPKKQEKKEGRQEEKERLRKEKLKKNKNNKKEQQKT